MKRILINSSTKALASAVFGVLLLSSTNTHATVSQSPLSLTVGVPPNMILTLDDSGSMREAFTPESIDKQRDTRRAKSAAYNTMYYDPTIKYSIPKKYATDGTESGSYSTSFTYAYYNGFQPALGGLDLSSAYRVSWWYKPSVAHSTSFTANDPNYSTNRQFADNPSADFGGGTISTDTTTSTSTRTDRQQDTNLRNCPSSIRQSTNSADTSTANADGSTTTVTTVETITYSNIRCTSTGSGTRTRYTSIATENITTTITTAVKTTSTIQTGVPAYYYTYNTSLSGCSGALTDDNCYHRVNVSSTSGTNATDERQNFAIWYSFYRNRALATMSAARLAFTDLSPAVRFTWQSLNKCTSLNGTNSGCGGDNKFREYAPAQRGRFFSWLDTLDFNSGTPLRPALDRAGKFLQTETAWHKFPNSSGNNSENTYACRPSYHVLMTDGIWNGDDGTPTDTRKHDGISFDLPDGKSYTSDRKPYGDSTKNTLADLAMHYWATDLNTTLPNKLSPYGDNSTVGYWNPRNDPATWQHMVNFTMGLGLTRSLDLAGLPWEGSTFAGEGYDNLTKDTAWPAAGSDNTNNVYDLWHAAINSRGEFFSVDSPNAMVQAFADILSRIADRKSSAARPAINSGQVSEDDITQKVSFQTSYASDENWSGDLKKTTTKATGESTSKKAGENLPAWNNRHIQIASSDADGLMDFSWANAGDATTAGTLGYYLSRNPEDANAADTKGEQRLDYLRGKSHLGTTFRERTSILGDIYSSSPVVVRGARYLVNFANQIEGGTSYKTFMDDMKARTGRVYVGANDGMLHGFNAETLVEEFSFIPTAVFPKLNKLTGTNYSHEFFVDGSPVVADVFNGTTWRTILVGTLKAGGKSIFALDITTPGSEKLLWEFSESSITGADAVKMGYSFSQPTIARLHTGKWAVVFGNGYESANHTNGKAALFILDALDGTLVKSLEVTGTAGIANGLSTPKLGDYNADGVADYAYAGDLQGNLWRFDLLRDSRSESNPFTREDDGESAKNDFEVSYGGSPMFSAVAANGTTRQSITSAPSLIRHPSGIGYMVIFGTGKFFETTDKDGDKSVAQTVYGIWDEKTKGEDATAPGITRAKLQAQTITNQVTATNADGSGGRTARVISNNAVQWNATDTAAKQHGWRLDLKSGALDGEMVVENMAALGQTVLFQSLIPNDDPCADGASNWSYAINPYTGGKTLHHVFDVRATVDGTTTVVSGIKQDGEGGLTVAQKPDQTFELCTGQECLSIYPDPNSMGRQSWRVVEEK